MTFASRLRRHLVAVTAALALSGAPLVAHAKKEPSRPAAPAAAVQPDPGKNLKLAGIITADVGIAALVAGVIMLGVQTTVTDDVGKRNGLVLGGGLLTGVGASAALIGTLIWLQGRKATADAKAKPTALLLPAVSASSAGATLLVRF